MYVFVHKSSQCFWFCRIKVMSYRDGSLVYSNSIQGNVIHLPVQPSDHWITFHSHSKSNRTFSYHTPSVHICNHSGSRGQLLALARRISCRSRICIWGSRTHNSRDSDWGLVQGWPMPPLWRWCQAGPSSSGRKDKISPQSEVVYQKEKVEPHSVPLESWEVHHSLTGIRTMTGWLLWRLFIPFISIQYQSSQEKQPSWQAEVILFRQMKSSNFYKDDMGTLLQGFLFAQ